ncbi:arabinan endo-1,5-alpha-L-arabinosidase [Deinococcus hopiensis]|nr:arabinan endo-1,5-alpha-L-arabinosidase [Deinococcus hopiensis]
MTTVRVRKTAAPHRLALTGDLSAHDPTLFKAGNIYYVFSTGLIQTEDDPGGILMHRSTGGITGPWEPIGAVAVPQWANDNYKTPHLWAPQVVKNGDTYHLYYAVSEFGKNHSAIGLAVSTNPGDPASWHDQGPILKSEPGDDHNAIDPMVFQDGGQWWITWGSFWSGLKLQKLRNMRIPTGLVTTLGSRPGVMYNPIEAPAILKRGNYYYLFMSWDSCCQGANSTYKIAVGRSKTPSGPYLDANGERLDEGGGTVLLTGRGNLHAAGGQDVFHEGESDYLIYHSYDAQQNYAPVMSIERLGWVNDWPVLK